MYKSHLITKAPFFVICVIQCITKIHDTFRILTMDKTKYVS